MHAHKLYTNVPQDHRLRLTVELPDDFPAGPVEVIVLATPGERKLVKLGGVLGSHAADLPTDEDPVAEALLELRRERQDRWRRLRKDTGEGAEGA